MIVPGAESPALRGIRVLLGAWVVTLVLALYPYTEDPATPVKLLVSGGFLVAIAALWLLGLVTKQASLRPVGPSVWLLGLVLAAQCVAALGTEAPARSLQALLPGATFTGLSFFAYQACSSPRHLRMLFRTVIGAVALSSLYGLGQRFGLDPFPWANQDLEEYRGLPATYGHPNFAGHTLVLAIPMTAALLVDGLRRRGHPLRCVLYSLALLLFGTHLYLTAMRAAWVALGLTTLAVLITLVLKRRGAGARTAWLGGITTAVALLLVAGAGLLLLAPHLNLDRSLQLRLHGYGGAAALLLDHPVTGVGPGNYAVENIPYWSDLEGRWYGLSGKRNQYVHNEWLEMAVTSGLLGLACLILLWLHRLVAPFREPEQASLIHYCLPAILLAAAIDACFGFNLQVPVSGGLLVVLLGIAPQKSPPWQRPSRRTMASATALLLLALLCGAQHWRHFQGERYYQQAQGALAWAREHPTQRAQLTALATDVLLDAQRLRPWDYRVPGALGELALSEGNPEEALPYLSRAAALHPHLPRIQLLLGRAYLTAAHGATPDARHDALEQARLHGKRALQYSSTLGEAHALLAWTDWNDERYRDQTRDRVISHLRAALDFGMGDNPAVLHALAQALHQEFLPLLEGHTRDGESWRRLKHAYHLQGDSWEEAGRAALRTVELAPDVPRYWDTLAAVAADSPGDIQGDYVQALRHHLVGTPAPGDALREKLASRLAALSQQEGERLVAARCLEVALDDRPSLDGLWSAWLRVLPERTATARFITHAAPYGDALGPVASAVLEILSGTPSPETVLKTLADLLAQDPGEENPDAIDPRLGPLLDRVDAPSPSGWGALELGRIAFYRSDYVGADNLLQQAERTLPATHLPEVNYYRSRVLAAPT